MFLESVFFPYYALSMLCFSTKHVVLYVSIIAWFWLNYNLCLLFFGETTLQFVVV